MWLDKMSVFCYAKLENGKLKFEERGSPTICTVRGGNLVAVNESGVAMSPIEPSTNVNVVLTQSSSASIAESDPDNIDTKLTEIHGEGSWKSGLVWNPQ